VRVNGSRRPPNYLIEFDSYGVAQLTFYENAVRFDKPRQDGDDTTPLFSEIENKNKAELLVVTEQLGITAPSNILKQDLLELLEQHLCGYEYDEYRMTHRNVDDLKERIEADIPLWLNHAKTLEHEKLAAEVVAYRSRLLDEVSWTLDPGVALSPESEAAVVAFRKALFELESRHEFPYIESYPEYPTITRIPFSEVEIKSREVSMTCERIINEGISLELGGEPLHFSMTSNDQMNISTAMSAVAQGAQAFPYHNDGGLCRLYSAEEIIRIFTAATQFIMYHRTYCNHLNYYIRNVTDETNLPNIFYGMDLPEDLAQNMKSILEQAQEL
jgi:hypothetical protein